MENRRLSRGQRQGKRETQLFEKYDPGRGEILRFELQPTWRRTLPATEEMPSETAWGRRLSSLVS
jgi:hypothetical protein